MFTCNDAFKFSDKEVTYFNNKLKTKWKFIKLSDMIDLNYPIWLLTNARHLLSLGKNSKISNENIEYENYFSLVSRFLPLWVNFKN